MFDESSRAGPAGTFVLIISETRLLEGRYLMTGVIIKERLLGREILKIIFHDVLNNLEDARLQKVPELGSPIEKSSGRFSIESTVDSNANN